MTLSDEKTHINDGFIFLGFHIQAKTPGGGRRVVLTIPSKNALASVMHKIKTLTKRGTTSLADGKLDHSCHCWEHFDVRMLYLQGRSAPCEAIVGAGCRSKGSPTRSRSRPARHQQPYSWH
jgi:hypothetical protein